MSGPESAVRDPHEPRVTVLVPSYNHARFVVATVQSVLDQTEPAVEVLVIDDGSTDDSLSRLAAIDDPRVTVLAHENCGLSRTLNRGLALARGRWVKLLPSDDMLAPRCLTLQLEAARADPGIGVVFCLPEVVDPDGRPLADPAPQAWFDTDARDEPAILPRLVERNFLCAPGALFDRDLARRVGGFDPALAVAQDYDLWLRLLPHTRATLVPRRLVRVRWHGGNQSAVATPATEAERERALRGALDGLGEERWAELFGGAAAGRLGLARALIDSGLPSMRPRARRLLEGIGAAVGSAAQAGAARDLIALLDCELALGRVGNPPGDAPAASAGTDGDSSGGAEHAVARPGLSAVHAGGAAADRAAGRGAAWLRVARALPGAARRLLGWRSR